MSPQWDVLIIGGGPAGATAGLLLARAGRRVLILEKTTFPRFHLGESLLPQNFPLIQELGLEAAVRKLPHTRKFGIEFATGDASARASFSFDQGLVPGPETVNLERAPFDKMLLDTAREAGAEVRENALVKKIVKLADEDVAIEVDGSVLTAGWLLDCSGQGTVVGRHLGMRVTASDPNLQKAAYFAPFEGVRRPEGRREGDPLIVMCEEGWFWLIPLDGTRTSVGLVLDPKVARRIDIPANRILAWGIERCPAVWERMEQATGPQTNQVIADFSYRCRPYAGPGYFLVGDAAAFIDPIFSTGVTLAMQGAQQAAMEVDALLAGRAKPPKARKRYIQFVEGNTKIFFRLIRHYYDHSLRELFLNGTGPLRVHSAVLSILAGEVFPRPIFALRWRLQLFYALQWLNRRWPLVPRRNRFSLLEAKPIAASPV